MASCADQIGQLKDLIWTSLKFRRPCGTEFGNGVLTQAPKLCLGGSTVFTASAPAALQAKIHFSFIRVMVDAPYQEAARRMGLVLTIGDGAWVNRIIARWENSGRPGIREYAS
jgi:hypothetical protein